MQVGRKCRREADGEIGGAMRGRFHGKSRKVSCPVMLRNLARSFDQDCPVYIFDFLLDGLGQVVGQPHENTLPLITLIELIFTDKTKASLLIK